MIDDTAVERYRTHEGFDELEWVYLPPAQKAAWRRIYTKAYNENIDRRRRLAARITIAAASTGNFLLGSELAKFALRAA